MFFIPCNLGFEDDLVTEIKETWPWLISLNGSANTLPYPEMVVDHGGVLVDAPFELGIQFNFFLKTAHRVLWRVADFKTRDFPKLFEKVKQIPLDKYLSSADVEWVVAASKSRLNNEKRIEETCSEAFAKSPATKSMSKTTTGESPQKIFVRTYDDQCTISLDSSGEHLHKRGWGSRKGEAPLRETLAAFCLRQMTKDASPGELEKITLVDAMCGSGTFLLEAISIAKPNFSRDYSFMSWKHTPKIFKTELWRKNYKMLAVLHPFAGYFGFDMDKKVLTAARENYGDMLNMLNMTAPSDVHFETQNLFADGGGDLFAKPRRIWCVANPPYGERLRIQGQGEFSYDDLLARMAKKYKAERIGLLLPDKSMVRNIKPPSGYEKSFEVPFSNGGLDVLFQVYQVIGTKGRQN